MSTFMNKSKSIVVIYICLLAIENANGFYRPLPSLLKNTLDIFLHKQLEKRFGPISTSTSPTPTTTTTTTTGTTSTIPSEKELVEKLEFSATVGRFYLDKCIKKTFQWCKTFKRIRNRLNRRIMWN